MLIFLNILKLPFQCLSMPFKEVLKKGFLDAILGHYNGNHVLFEICLRD